MSKISSRAELVASIQGVRSCSVDEAEAMLDTFVNALKKAFLELRRVELRGLGVFQPSPKRNGTGRDVKYGRVVPIPEGWTIRYKPSSRLHTIAVKEGSHGHKRDR